MTISPTHISVVVQGPVTAEGSTQSCLMSVRQHLPGAEIVLSTWQGADTAGLDFDTLVQSEDPGALVCHRRLPNLYNLNRQILSTREGLKAATRRYAAKLRSDLVLTGTGFLNYQQRYPRRDTELRIFRERVVNCTVYAQNPRRHQPTPFHPGDWFFFGLRDDLLELWDIPLAPEPETSRWFAERPRPQPDRYPHLLHRFFPEQYLWLCLMQRHAAAGLEHSWDLTEQNLEQTERSFANNLILLEPERIGIRSLKHRLRLDAWANLYSHGEWQRLYARYCDSEFRAPFDTAAAGKDLYRACRLLFPKRLADRMLTGLLNRDSGLLESWELKSPRTFQLARALHKWLG
jgi:hypothetical protein